jgi:hypothetical protein
MRRWTSFMAIRRINYQVDLNVWLSPAGVVRHFEILAPTADVSLNGEIATVVRDVEIGRAPPQALPQPVHVRIFASGAD